MTLPSNRYKPSHKTSTLSNIKTGRESRKEIYRIPKTGIVVQQHSHYWPLVHPLALNRTKGGQDYGKTDQNPKKSCMSK